jgi:GntP family gluconate:H+ symporter
MSTPALLGIAAGGIALLLYLIIRLQVHAFVALMLVSLLVAMATSMPVADIVPTMIAGMGGTLGSVAILVAPGVSSKFQVAPPVWRSASPKSSAPSGCRPR